MLSARHPLGVLLSGTLALCALGGAACGTSLVMDTSTGSGGTTGAPGTGGATGTGGAAPACSGAADCAALVDACHTASCEEGLCVRRASADATPCDDGLFCTEGDQCLAGVCVGGAMMACAAGAACEIPTCDEAAQACTLTAAPDGQSCDDGNPCTLAGACQSGVCTAGASVSCAQLDSTCTTGVCDPQSGCHAQPTNEGGPCDDGLFCTVGDVCVAGTCKGAPRVCPQPADVCRVGACDEATNSCGQAPGNDGTFCDDGNPCTTSEKCHAGVCGGGAPISGTTCDDGDACTHLDTCNAGVCSGSPVACVSGDGCCPPGCLLQGDLDCIYWASGVQKNVPETKLEGWELCYRGTYDEGLMFALPTILQQCNRARMLLACRPVGASSFDVVAMADRADALFDCGTQTNCTHQANGVGWYFANNFSWGLAPAGQAVNRVNCDSFAGSDRLCWFTDGQAGAKCGTNVALWNTWERVVYHAY
jgi:hypothetical protein